MLPSHLQIHKDDDDDDHHRHSDQQRRLRHYETPPLAQPPLGITGVLCDSHSFRVHHRGVLHYTIFRPRHWTVKPPLVCISGGPLMPSSYLHPLVHLITDRSILFYDQLGSGQSKLLPGQTAVDIAQMVNDLQSLINHLPMQDFHLYGHSFGGILAYEYLKLHSSETTGKSCRSVTLSSTPVSVRETVQHCNKLLEDIRKELGNNDQADSMEEAQRVFSTRHECRIQPLPLPLQQSYQMAGFQSSRSGLQSVQDYVATTATSTQTSNLPPALILQGQYDFVNAQAWGQLFDKSQYVVLAGCAHYGLLENERLYATILLSFLQDHDPELTDIILPNGVHIRR